MKTFYHCIFLYLFFFCARIPVLAQTPALIYKKDLSSSNIVSDSILKKISFINDIAAVRLIDNQAVPPVNAVGLINRNGKFILTPQFDTVANIVNSNMAVVGKKIDKYIRFGLVDLKNINNNKAPELILLTMYEIASLHANLFAAKITPEGGWQFYNASGIIISPHIFQNFSYNKFGTLAIKLNHKWGILGTNGEFITQPVYKSIVQSDYNKFVVEKFNTWIQTSSKGIKSDSLEYDSLKSLTGTLHVFYSNKKAGVIHANHDIVLPAYYDSITILSDKYLLIKKNNLYGIADTIGTEILPVTFYKIHLDKKGYIHALSDEIKVLRYGEVINKEKKKWNLFDSTGKKVFPQQYFSIQEPSEELIAAKNNEGLFGYINLKGQTIIPFKYAAATDFANGLALVAFPDGSKLKHAIIDKEENIYYKDNDAIIFNMGLIYTSPCKDTIKYEAEPESEIIYGVPPYRYDSFTKTDFGYIKVSNGPYSGILNPEGKEAVYAYQDTIYKASDDTTFLYKRNNGLVGYSDKYCHITLALTDKFQHVEPMHNGYSRFKKEGMYGFIDCYGNVQIAPKYETCSQFSNDMAAVVLKGKWGFINKQELLTVQPYYKEVRPFRNGFAPVKGSTKWSFINKKGQAVNTTLYDHFYALPSGKYIVIKNKTQHGITDSSGKEILSPKYDGIKEIGSSYLKVKRGGKYGVMDYHENILFSFQYDDIEYDPITNNFWLMTEGKKEEIIINIQEKK